MKTISHVLNLFCLEFAAWTVCANIVVRLQGNLKVLLLAALPVLTAVAWLYLRHRRRFEGSEGAGAQEADGNGRRQGSFSRLAGLLGLLIFFVSVFLIGKGHIFVPWVLCVVFFVGLAWAELRQGRLGFPAAPSAPPLSGQPAPRALRRAPLLIWIVALLAAGLTLAAHRPDLDDSYYVNMAVGVAESPGDPILLNCTLYDLPDFPLSFRPYQFHSVEVLAGALSYLTGLPAIAFLHYVLAGLAAILCILAYGRLAVLTERHRPALAVLLVLMVLLFLGATHRSYGNFALVRLFQGKAVYATAIVPLILYAALRFSIRPGWAGWCLLLAAQVCGLGMTSSSLYVTPLLVLVSLLAGCRSFNKKSLLALGAGLASLFYLASVILYLWIRHPVSGLTAPVLKKPDPLVYLGGNITTVIGQGRPLLFASGVFLLSWFFLRPGLGRRLALAAPLVFLLTVLNPLLVPLFSKIEPFEFWRFFWAFPLPFFIAGLILSPFRLTGRVPGWAAAAASGLLLALFLLMGGSFVLRPENGVRLGPPSLKVEAYYDLALDLARSVPRRSLVLASDPVNIWLATVQPHVFPFRVRGYEFQAVKARCGPAEVWWREFMVAYLDGASHSPNDGGLFRLGLERFRPAAVCLPRGLAWRPEAAGLLREQGYVYSRTLRRHDLWVRPSSFQPALHQDR